ncbi:uncharacterized protein LOC131224956 [Magnolia sinica]|uniref:uncharacterized protein LOC131224956 n=1 Tax=Magnolia sinica TaxID=86752 RepID=UPI002659205B|nr:uncharacterized protein LOC131224956 [Magnolia sinica]
MLLELLKEALPEGEMLPKSFYEMKKIIGELGLKYNKIDACPNDCMLYWKETINEQSCAICGTSRWKMVEHQSDDEGSSFAKDRKIPTKILRHFPLKPRLQRLFMSSKTASSMKWHEVGRTDDGILRHPSDSPAWKTFDHNHPSFSSDGRNVRLGLAADGFNPFRTMSIAHSTWPVILIPYNLPPWMCMKQPNLMLSLLIPGPYGPGNDIDVYMQPLIDELKELWEVGADTYDASSNETFRLRAALLWTINDFPAYANLSGWSTKGRLACPCCNKDTSSKWLIHGRKFCYMGHRRFLEHDHKFRTDSRSFDGTEEFGEALTPLFGSDVLVQLQGINVTFGKKTVGSHGHKRRREDNEEERYNWKKKSIFFDLPYWKHNLLRHNLDVMHIEKNICDNVLATLLNIAGKTKDSVKARLNLQHMAGEAKIARPVQYRWYPIERYLLTLKSYVRNRSRPEGSITEGYLAKECLTFYSRYLHGTETWFNRPIRNDDYGNTVREEQSSIFPLVGRALGKSEDCVLDNVTFVQAHRYVLEHMNVVKRMNRHARPRDIERIHNDTFYKWFSDRVEQLRHERNEQVSEDLRWLARGPSMARRYKGFIVNGFRFHTKDCVKKRKTQHSGVVVTTKTSSFASANDRNPIAGDVTYYGVLTDIIELEYCGQHLSDEPFVFASQAEQVFYVQDLIEKDWHVVVMTKPRDLFEMHGQESADDVDTFLGMSPCDDQCLEDPSDDTVSWERTDVDGTTIVLYLPPTQPMVEEQIDDTELSNPIGDDILYNN